jgi:hypothetical protein
MWKGGKVEEWNGCSTVPLFHYFTISPSYNSYSFILLNSVFLLIFSNLAASVRL